MCLYFFMPTKSVGTKFEMVANGRDRGMRARLALATMPGLKRVVGMALQSRNTRFSSLARNLWKRFWYKS